MFRTLNRRHLVALGLGFLATSFPASLLKFGKSGYTVVDLNIRFPDGYTLVQYEYDVPSWAKNDELRDFIKSFMREGKLLGYEKSSRMDGVHYRFTFNSRDDLMAFISGVRERGLVDFESRSNRGLATVVQVDGVEIEC